MTDQATREAAADLLDGALDILHERGWCQQVFAARDGSVCIAGALTTAAGGQSHVFLLSVEPNYDAWHAARQALDDACEMQVETFNDLSTTTREDVLLVAKRAAHSLREVTA